MQRVDGEVVHGGPAIVLVDPWTVGGVKKRPSRIELYEVKYEVRGIILLHNHFHGSLGACSTTRILLPPSSYVSLGCQCLPIDTNGSDPEILFRTRTDP